MNKVILKHILIRIGFIIGIPILLSPLILLTANGNTDAAGNAMARGLAMLFTIGISLIIITVGLLVDIFILYRKKEKNKFKASLVLLIVILLFLIMPILIELLF